jgi:hypothetical protein
MSIEHHWEGQGIYIRYGGSITGAQLLRAALDQSGDPRFDDMRYVIIDLFNAQHSTVNADDMKEMAAYIRAMGKSNANVRLAVVMFPDSKERQALAYLYKQLVERSSWDTRVFHTLEEAREWVHSVPGAGSEEES